MKKDCFNCRFEPEWWGGVGKCRWFKYNNVPVNCQIEKQMIYKGIPFLLSFECKCWSDKDDEWYGNEYP